jgi:hypothetical protein
MNKKKTKRAITPKVETQQPEESQEANFDFYAEYQRRFIASAQSVHTATELNEFEVNYYLLTMTVGMRWGLSPEFAGKTAATKLMEKYAAEGKTI